MPAVGIIKNEINNLMIRVVILLYFYKHPCVLRQESEYRTYLTYNLKQLRSSNLKSIYSS